MKTPNEKFNEHYEIIESLVNSKDRNRSLRILSMLLSQVLMVVSESERNLRVDQIKWFLNNGN